MKNMNFPKKKKLIRDDLSANDANPIAASVGSENLKTLVRINIDGTARTNVITIKTALIMP